MHAVATSDPKDLALLSRIERELGQDPPPAVHALIRRRADGAGRSELVAGAQKLEDLRLRVLVLRWVDEVFPPPGGPKAPAVPGASSSGPSVVKPLEPKP